MVSIDVLVERKARLELLEQQLLDEKRTQDAEAESYTRDLIARVGRKDIELEEMAIDIHRISDEISTAISLGLVLPDNVINKTSSYNNIRNVIESDGKLNILNQCRTLIEQQKLNYL